MKLSLEVVVITGGTEGIGYAVAQELIENNYLVVCIDCKQKNQNEDFDFFKCDVTDFEETNHTFQKIYDKYKRIDILINCVGGTLHSKGIEDISDLDWEKTFSLNLKSSFNCIKAVFPIMKCLRYGRIINISAVAGRTYTFFGGVDFAAAKTAVIGLTRQCAYEFSKYGITVNAIAPGLTMTERVKQIWNKYDNVTKDNILKKNSYW